MQSSRLPQSSWFAAPAALVYALISTYLFQAGSSDLFVFMSLSFICGLPIVVGVLTVLFAPPHRRTDLRYGAMMPLLPITLLTLIALVLQWEVWVCVAMALPIFWALGAVSGLITTAIYRRRLLPPAGGQPPLLPALVLLPFLLAPLEAQFALPDSIHPIETAIIVRADPQILWDTLTSVPEIQPEEERWSAFQLLGLPRPKEAMLNQPGVGGTRFARYSNGLRILEPVTVWEPPHRFAFGVELDPSVRPPRPFGAVGGRFFEVQQVAFTLEPLPDGTTRLRLPAPTAFPPVSTSTVVPGPTSSCVTSSATSSASLRCGQSGRGEWLVRDPFSCRNWWEAWEL